MKNKIIFIVVIICFSKNVYAETFYGKYRSVKEVGNYIEEDEVFVDTYSKEYIDLGYKEDNSLFIKDEKNDETIKKNKVTDRHYKKNIIKLNNYVEKENNILEDVYIEKNDIYVRDKLVLKNNLIINNKNTNVFDLIEYSTDMIDINIVKNIEVDISKELEKETILETQKNILDEKQLKKRLLKKTTINEENTNRNAKDNIISNINNTQNQKTKNKPVKYVSTLKNISNTTTKNILSNKIKNNSKENVNKLKEKNILNIVKLFIFFNLIVIEIILYIKKRNRNNVERV